MKTFLSKMKNRASKIKQVFAKPARRIKGVWNKLLEVKGMQQVIEVVKIPFIGYLLLALVLNVFLETLSRHSLIKAFYFIGESPLVFLYNAFIIFVTLSLVLFAKRKVFATIFVCAVWIISAFANWIVLCFRTTPFSAVDILMLRNVMTMLDKYMTKWQMVLSAIGILLVIALLIYLYIRLPKTKHKRQPFRASAYVCMCAVLIVTLTKVAVETQTVSDNFGNLAYAYNDYGFAYCFSNSIIDVGISKPKNYSEETVKAIVEELNYNKSEVILVTKEEAEAEQQEEMLKKSKEAGEAELQNTNISGTESTVEAKENETSETEERSEESGSKTDKENKDSDDTAAENEEVTSSGRSERADGRIDEDIIAGFEKDDTDKELTKGDAGKAVDEKKDSEKITDIDDLYYKNQPATKEYPNIIVIQIESVFDTKYMKDFYASENPMPFLAKLKRKYSSGLFTVPAVGAGTANTEFEVQTGMSTQFFGAGEYPFKTVMRDMSCDSIAYDLKRQGYATAGFHNNDATFYERYIDYSNLGFDVFSGMEHMYNLNYTPRGWAKDDVLDDLMIERMKQTEGRDYITTITVQCHGRYPKKHTETLTDLDCYFTGQYEQDSAKQAAWEYYINMCKECDNMLEDLVTKLERLDEPTVLFMYGDHLPSLDLQETDLDGITLYETEWVMWDNIGLRNEKKDLKAYQASTYIFNRLGLEGGLMQSFHNKYMDSADQDDYLDKLELLEYDTLYGNNYAFDEKNPFPQTDMTMGIRKIAVNRCEIKDEGVFIYGKNFNEFSVVHVDGKAVDTAYVSGTTLSVALEDFKGAKEVLVAQVGDDHIVLSRTEPYIVLKEEALEVTTEQAGEENKAGNGKAEE